MVYYAVDIIAATITEYSQQESNIWFYNVSLLFEILLYFYVFNCLIISNTYKKLIVNFALVFFITDIINMTSGQGINVLSTYTLIPAHIFVVLLAYLHMKLTIENIDLKPLLLFSFWFSIATFISVATSIPVLSIINSLNDENLELASKIFILNDIAYCSWYCLIIVGLLWTRKHTKI